MERRASANTVAIKTGYLSFMIEHVSVRVTVIYFGGCSFRHKYLSTSKSIQEITRNPRSNRKFVFVRVISWIIFQLMQKTTIVVSKIAAAIGICICCGGFTQYLSQSPTNGENVALE